MVVFPIETNMKQKKIQTTTTLPEDLYTTFRAIAAVKYKKYPYQSALCEAIQRYIEENKDLLPK